MNRPTWTRDLLTSERAVVTAMHRLGYGRYDLLPIRAGEFVLDPWPPAIRCTKLGTSDPLAVKQMPEEFVLKPQVIELFEYVRSIDVGEIRNLLVKNGLPFSFEVLHQQAEHGGGAGA